MRPYPEILGRPTVGRWRIREWRGDDPLPPHTDLVAREMAVPLGGTCEWCGRDHVREIQDHEMAHVAWSPPDVTRRLRRLRSPRPSPEAIMLAEDVRIADLSHRLRSRPLGPVGCEARWRDFADRLGLADPPTAVRAAIGMILATWGTADGAAVLHALRPRLAEILDGSGSPTGPVAIVRAIEWAVAPIVRARTSPRWRHTVAVARRIDQLLRSIPSILGDGDGDPDPDASASGPAKGRGRGDPDALWGPAEIVDLASDPDARRVRVTRPEIRPDHSGRMLRPFRPDGRWAGRVTPRPVGGGTVLVDRSGSMEWRAEDLERILREIPAATVATYCGDGYRGWIDVIVRDGRAATSVPWRPGDNTVDGPALRWLAGQRGPRVWVSDGYVTGPGPDALLRADAARVIRAGRIMQVRTVDEAIAVCAGRVPHRPSPGLTLMP